MMEILFSSRPSVSIRTNSTYSSSCDISISRDCSGEHNSSRVLRSGTHASMPIHTLRSQNVDLKVSRLSIHVSTNISICVIMCFYFMVDEINNNYPVSDSSQIYCQAVCSVESCIGNDIVCRWIKQSAACCKVIIDTFWFGKASSSNFLWAHSISDNS